MRHFLSRTDMLKMLRTSYPDLAGVPDDRIEYVLVRDELLVFLTGEFEGGKALIKELLHGQTASAFACANFQ